MTEETSRKQVEKKRTTEVNYKLFKNIMDETKKNRKNIVDTKKETTMMFRTYFQV